MGQQFRIGRIIDVLNKLMERREALLDSLPYDEQDRFVSGRVEEIDYLISKLKGEFGVE